MRARLLNCAQPSRDFIVVSSLRLAIAPGGEASRSVNGSRTFDRRRSAPPYSHGAGVDGLTIICSRASGMCLAPRALVHASSPRRGKVCPKASAESANQIIAEKDAQVNRAVCAGEFLTKTWGVAPGYSSLKPAFFQACDRCAHHAITEVSLPHAK
jgi:hypothetical protein